MSKPRVLVFSTLSPLPLDRGDRSRLYHVLRHLREMADVRLIYVSRAWEPPVSDWSRLEGIDIRAIRVTKAEVFRQTALALLQGRPSTFFRFHTPRVAAFVREQAAEFRPGVFWGMPTEACTFYHCADGVRRVLDMVDSLTLYHESLPPARHLSPYARVSRLLQPRLQHFERAALREADSTLVSSEANRAHLRRHGIPAEINVLYAAVPDEFLQRRWHPESACPARMLFVGHQRYPPNVLAVRHAVTRILPLVRARIPQAELIVCGGGSMALAREFAGTPGVTFTGFVEDLINEYQSASLLLAPVPFATGIQTKMVEAMALGLPTVVSEASLRANDLTHGYHALAADTDVGYVDAAVAVLKDRALALRLADNGRALIMERHTQEVQRQQIARILDGVLEAPAARCRMTPDRPGGLPVMDARTGPEEPIPSGIADSCRIT